MPEDVNKNQVALQILLFTAERNWAHAINFKNINVAKQGKDSRQKFHARKKFKKAVKSAQELLDLVQKIKIDPQSVLESSAYLETMKAYSDIEYAEYEKAMEHLFKAKIIYEKI